MDIYDSHIHLGEDGFAGIKKALDEGIISKGLLILNSKKEVEMYKTFKTVIDKYPIKVALCVDPRSWEQDSDISFAKDVVAIKIHPRLSGITKKDFELVYKTVDSIPIDTIIVDCFGYGPEIEYHVGMELGVEIARRFPAKKVVFAHAGGERLLECFLYTGKMNNVYYDISLIPTYLYGTSAYVDLKHFLTFHSGKIMFGSDYPDIDIEKAINATKELCISSGVGEKEIADILFDNAARVYEGIG